MNTPPHFDWGRERILVTGAAGFIGSHLVDRLLTLGCGEVVGLDNFDPFYDRRLKERNLASAQTSARYSLVTADIRDASALGRIFSGREVTTVVHLAAKAGVRPSIEAPDEYSDVNVTGTQRLLTAAAQTGVAKIVFASSSSVYGDTTPVPFSEAFPVADPISPYAATKLAGELLCKTHVKLHPARIIALRFFTVYGPRQRPDLAIRKFAEAMLDGRSIPVFGDGSTARDYTWIGDIVDGMIGAIQSLPDIPERYTVLNLGESQTTTLAALIALLEEALGMSAKIDRQSIQPGDVTRTFADTSRARALIGYAPHTTMQEGIGRFVAWLREERASHA